MSVKRWEHQENAFQKLKDQEYGALLMEMGTGKSKTAIDIAFHKYQKGEIETVILICPSPLRRQWAEQQLPEHHPGIVAPVIWEASRATSVTAIKERKAKLWDLTGNLKWFIVNVETFSSDNHMAVFNTLVQKQKVMVIIDEATRIKNPSAKRTGNIRKIGEKAVARLLLTGTLITNSPFDAWAPFEFLRPGFWGMTYFGFRARYGIEALAENPFGGKYRRSLKPGEIRKIRAQEKKYPVSQIALFNKLSEADVRYILGNPELEVPYKHLNELKDAIDSTSFQVRKEEALDLPEKIYQVLDIEMTPTQKKIYRELKEHLLAVHKGETLTVANALSLITRLQQVTGGFFPHNDLRPPEPITGGNPKINALIGELDDLAGSPVVVWSRFVAEIQTLGEVLTKEFPEREVAVYHGGVLPNKRADIVQAFQSGEVDILIANPQTAGFGLNLQRAHTAFYFSQSYSLEERMQSEDRIHRAGQTVSCTYLDLVIKGTVDEAVRDALLRKTSLSDYFSSHTLEEFLG